ncbi:hypothetical protein DL98DRAFT_579836 [Cadophora sp. DSE1049]|nr:hypothetical protein DL98DRAFT_579836 [Cadophora sp. DSE1049]
MSSFSDIPLRPRESLPPFIISVYGDDNPLAPDGRHQCASFICWFRPQVPYITHIVSSPLLRASQIANEALKEVIDSEVKWLGLRDTGIWDRGEVSEVVIVRHGLLLWDLLGEDYRPEDFQVRSYVVERDGNLKRITHSTLRAKRRSNTEPPKFPRTFVASDISLTLGGETAEKAMRRERALQIRNIIHLRPAEIQDFREVSQVPGVG